MAEIPNKLTRVVPTTLGNEGFTLRLRYPGWMPDELIVTDKNGNTTMEPLFVEEALGAFKDSVSKAERFPFQPPIDSRWSDFSWIMGQKLQQLDPDRNPVPQEEWNDFNKWLLELTRLSRNYNASLYRLRRLHLIAEGNIARMLPLPTDGGKVLTPAEAESDYQKATVALRQILTPRTASNPFITSIADMVQVNGYIVSLRAVVEIFVGEINIMSPQPGGSSSSQVLVDDPFSSSSP